MNEPQTHPDPSLSSSLRPPETLALDGRKLIAEQPSQNTRSNFNIRKNVSSEQQQIK